MKQILLYSLIGACLVCSATGCGTVFGGKISQCQQTKPIPPQEKRHIRPAALIGDLLTGAVWLAADFATGGIYQPCDEPKIKK